MSSTKGFDHHWRATDSQAGALSLIPIRCSFFLILMKFRVRLTCIVIDTMMKHFNFFFTKGFGGFSKLILRGCSSCWMSPTYYSNLCLYITFFYFIYFLLYYIRVPKWYVNSIIFKINVIYILNKDSHKIDGSYYEYYTFPLSLNHVGEIVTTFRIVNQVPTPMEVAIYSLFISLHNNEDIVYNMCKTRDLRLYCLYFLLFI